MIYDMLAPFYDKFNGDIDYGSWADFIVDILKKHGRVSTTLGLDLGCGTGSMTISLQERGYDMTGIDYSPEMLDLARERGQRAGFDKKILWLCQDMTEFELYGTVDFAVCTLDGINHLTSLKALDKCFNLVHNYLVPDGLFIFDVNGKYKFENIYSDNTYVFDEDGAFCVWENSYNQKRGICDFLITLFSEESDGRYSRCEELQRERMYTLNSIKKHLQCANLEFVGAYSDFEYNPGDDGSERIYIVARCKK